MADKTSVINSDMVAEVTQEAPIESFSYDTKNATPKIDDQYLDVDTISAELTVTPTQAVTKTDAAATKEPEAKPISKPEKASTKKHKSKYADIGISIAKDYVNLRKKPSTSSKILGKLYKGSACEIKKTKGNWYYVESGSVNGYVKTEFIKANMPNDKLMRYGTLSISVECDGLNVRKTASTDSKRVTLVYKDEVYPVLKQKGKWLKIKVPDDKVKGYVKTEFTDLIIEFKEAISTKEEKLIKQLKVKKKAEKLSKIKKLKFKKQKIQKQKQASYNYSKVQLLACLIHAEAGHQSYETKLAVANVVLNRMRSGIYPRTMKAVVYQRCQFTVAASGSLKKQLNHYKSYSSQAEQLSIKAAKAALAGSNNIGKRMHFNSYGAAVRKGYHKKSNAAKMGGLLFW